VEVRLAGFMELQPARPADHSAPRAAQQLEVGKVSGVGRVPWCVSSRGGKAAIVGVWVVVVAAWTWHLRSSGQSPADWLQGGIDAADGAWWAIPAFVAVYLVRPIVLFPASLLTIAAGILFGPVLGVPVALGAATASAYVAYRIGTTLTPAAVRAGDGATVIDRWSVRMRNESFLTVMLMRLAFLPYDLVNYAAGFLRINAGAFVVATALGSLPGTVAFVLAGASLQRLDAGLDGFDPRVFAASLMVFVVSVGVSKVVQRRAAPAPATIEATDALRG
jgi:uncharacterized membrane protein YdjX (TVP38/TMEM64 family)